MTKYLHISVNLTSHPKMIKLMRRLGDKAFFDLLQLWAWTARNKPDGDFSGMDIEDIEIAAKWSGKPGSFVSILLDLGLLDQRGTSLCVHDWAEHQDVQMLIKIAKGWIPGTRFMDVTPSEWRSLRLRVFERDKYVCQYCGCHVDNPECDHVTPRSRGGESSMENLVTACPSCNRSKGAKTPEEWMQ